MAGVNSALGSSNAVTTASSSQAARSVLLLLRAPSLPSPVPHPCLPGLQGRVGEGGWGEYGERLFAGFRGIQISDADRANIGETSRCQVTKLSDGKPILTHVCHIVAETDLSPDQFPEQSAPRIREVET